VVWKRLWFVEVGQHFRWRGREYEKLDRFRDRFGAFNARFLHDGEWEYAYVPPWTEVWVKNGQKKS